MDGVGLLPLVARWWWVLALAALVAAAGGYAAATRLPKIYQAEVQALVGPINTDDSLDASGALASTYADLATSQTVLDVAIASTGSRLSTEELDKATTALSNQVTRIVTITVEDRDPIRAAQLANALARHLRDLSTQDESASERVVEVFEDQPEIQALRAGLQRRLGRVARRVFGPSTAGRLTIFNPARPPESAVKPVVPLLVLLAATGGLLVGVIFVLLVEARRSRRRSSGPPPEAKPDNPSNSGRTVDPE